MRYLGLCLALTLPAFAQAAANDPQPTAWTARVQPQDAVERITMPPVDETAYRDEDGRYLAETGQKKLRFAASLKVDLTPETAGTWERLDTGELLWRLRVYSKGARSLNFGFDRYLMPAGGRLFIHSADRTHVYRPFTADDNEDHGQLWTPVVFGDESLLEVTIPESARGELQLHLAVVNHDYRGFGRPDMEKDTGACNIDVVCPIGNPYNDQDRAVAAITLNGTDTCSGSLVNNTANDAKPYFMTAFHCGVDAGDAAAMVAYWNYFNSTCRPQGTGTVPPGNGSLSQFNSGALFRAGFSPSDFTLVELDDPLSPAFNLFLAGWDRTTGQFNSPVGVHHPGVEEMRITFSTVDTQNGVFGGQPPENHLHAFWGTNLGVTEPGSSGSPLYTAQGRYLGQLHGGPSSCTAADKSDFYGRLSVSWTGGGSAATRASNWLDPGNTGAITLDGRNACTFPAAPTAITAAATAPNTIQVAWDAVSGASGYNVFRAVGACPQTSYTQIGFNVAANSFTDTTVSGGITYSYVVQSVVSGCPSLNSGCAEATATGSCTLAPAFAGLASATSAGTSACAIDLAWSAATAGCSGTTVKYNVYRSTTAGAPPSAATLHQSCLTTLNFTDTTVISGTRYHYVVRAEDSQGNGTGACNSGVQDANAVERSAIPGGLSATVTDNVESGNSFWTTAGGTGGNVWAIVTTQANSPTHSWSVADPDVVTDQSLATVAAGNIPAAFVLSFFNRYNTESTTGATGFDGHVLEYSLDGTTWTDILAAQGPVPANAARFLQNGYNRTISTFYDSPLAGRQAWSGDNVAFQEVRVDMADFSGRFVSIRVRFASDISVADQGVWIDDITFRFPGACSVFTDLIFRDGFDAGLH